MSPPRHEVAAFTIPVSLIQLFMLCMSHSKSKPNMYQGQRKQGNSTRQGRVFAAAFDAMYVDQNTQATDSTIHIRNRPSERWLH